MLTEALITLRILISLLSFLRGKCSKPKQPQAGYNNGKACKIFDRVATFSDAYKAW
jgi:hypothetical protein